VRVTVRLTLILGGIATLFFLARRSGSFLVVHRPHPADVIIVLAGDLNDRRYWTALDLLQSGYGREMLVDESEELVVFGHTYADWARAFITEKTPALRDRVKVCPIGEDSTVSETKYVAQCLAPKHANSVLLVTSDFHTRRALSIFRRRLPDYTWYVAAAIDPTRFGAHWWLKREWAKTAVSEWQKLLLWEIVEKRERVGG